MEQAISQANTGLQLPYLTISKLDIHKYIHFVNYSQR